MKILTISEFMEEIYLGTIILAGCLAISVTLTCQIAKLERWHRRRKNDRRIIKQAKATGVWYKPLALEGRALELKVKKAAGMKRKSGETDAELRRRYEIRILEACAYSLGVQALELWHEYERAKKTTQEGDTK